MKLKLDIKKLLIKNLILCGGLLLIQNNIESNAIDGDLDLTHKSIVRDFSGLNDDEFKSVVKAQSGGYIAVGYSSSKNVGFIHKGGDDAIVVKYDREGNKQWVKDFGGSNYDTFNSVVETSDKGIVAVGFSNSTDAEFSAKGDMDAIIIKYDSEGNKQWIKNFGGSKYDTFNSVIETSDKGIIAIGYSNSTDAGFTNRGSEDAIIVKYDSEGNEQWIKNFGGASYDVFNSVIETSDKGIVAVGRMVSTNAGFINKGRNDAVVVKYDKDGNQLWVKNFGGASDDFFNSVVETSDNGIVAIGYSNSTDAGFSVKGNIDAIVVKYDNEGNQLWVKNFGGSSDDYFNSVIETSDKGIIAVGYSYSTNAGFVNKGNRDAIVVKYNENGSQLWVKNFGGSNNDRFYSVIETNDKGILAVGGSNSKDAGFSAKGNVDAVIIKYNQDCKNNEYIFDKVYDLGNVDSTINNVEKLEEVRSLVNNIQNEELRRYLNEKLDSSNIGFGELERKTYSSNLDIYIKCENALILGLDTNSVAFEDFSGVEDVVKENAVNIHIKSSLPYQLNAYLPIEIQNSDKTNTMNKQILNIKENSERDYKEFTNINEKVVLKDNCPSGNDLVHRVDLKLVGGIAHEKDIYKTTIKFEIEQK